MHPPKFNKCMKLEFSYSISIILFFVVFMASDITMGQEPSLLYLENDTIKVSVNLKGQNSTVFMVKSAIVSICGKVTLVSGLIGLQ